jgi:hypothetical protein
MITAMAGGTPLSLSTMLAPRRGGGGEGEGARLIAAGRWRRRGRGLLCEPKSLSAGRGVSVVSVCKKRARAALATSVGMLSC